MHNEKFPNPLRRLMAALLAFTLLLFAACGGGSSGPVPTQITRQPASLAVATGSDATFSVEAAGDALAYQWQRSNDAGTTWTPVAGAVAAAYTLAAAPAGASGARLRVLVSGSNGSVTSEAATLTVADPPAISRQPADAATSQGSAVEFSVAADGGPPLTYQWQTSSDGGSTFADVPGATTDTLAITAPTSADNGRRYRVQVGNAVGSVTSRAATLSVTGPPTIQTPPQATTVAQGQAAGFSVVAAGAPAPTYQWQRSNDGNTWTSISGATQASYTTPATTAADNGDRFRVVVRNSEGSVTSDAAVLTVTPPEPPPPPAAVACSPWSQPDGTVVQVTYPSTVPGVGGVATQTTRQGVTFDGRTTSEVTFDTPLSSTTTLVNKLYATVAASGVMTLYGTDSVASTTGGGSSTSQRTTIVYEPAIVRQQFALAAGGSDPLVPAAPARQTVVVTTDGVAGPPTTTSVTEVISALRFVGYETVTVPAGTFDTCKVVITDEKNVSRTEWNSRRWGFTVQRDGGNAAERVVVNGTAVTHD